MFARLCRVLSVLSLLSISTLSQAQLTDPLAIENGLLSGQYVAGMQIYRGIPYAAPPVGAMPTVEDRTDPVSGPSADSGSTAPAVSAAASPSRPAPGSGNKTAGG